MTSNNFNNFLAIFTYGIKPLSENLPEVSSWNYAPAIDSKSSYGFLGIKNLSNICYMIAMLQQFYMTPAFRYAILSANDYQDSNIKEVLGRKYDDNLFHQLQRMFAYMDLSDRKDYKPTMYCRSFIWEGQPVNVSIQQDSTDFVAKFLDQLETSLKATPYKTIYDSIYQGSTVSWMQCQNCKYERVRPQTFYN